MGYAELMQLPGVGPGVADAQVAEQVEIQAKYAGYIERQHEEIARQRRHEALSLPADLDYAQVRGLSREVCKLAAPSPGYARSGWPRARGDAGGGFAAADSTSSAPGIVHPPAKRFKERVPMIAEGADFH